MPTVHLRDINASVVAAWKETFSDAPFVEISHGNILAHTADAIVSPASSFGYMDGGIDLEYSNFFGWQLQERLQKLLAEQYYGELPVGQALTIETKNSSIPHLVCAPTMRVPSSVARTVNVYLAFRAALIAVLAHNRTSGHQIESLLVPGLGTGMGEVPPRRAARQMRFAYEAVVNGRGAKERNAGLIWGEHYHLLFGPDEP